MCKYIAQLLVLSHLCGIAFCQRATEHINISWPGEYNWKTVRQGHDGNKQYLMIIPGNDSISNATIIGSLTAYRGEKFPNLDEVIGNYQRRIDSGTKLTVVEKQLNAKYPWVIFKVETPATSKYPEPEADLYYVVQGKFGLYENYVAIKTASLSEEFVKKWMAVFMTGTIVTE